VRASTQQRPPTVATRSPAASTSVSARAAAAATRENASGTALASFAFAFEHHAVFPVPPTPAAALQPTLQPSREPRSSIPSLASVSTPRAAGAGPSTATIRLPRNGFVHPVARSMARPGVRFRVPEYARVKSAYADKDLKIPETVIKERVTQLLERMEVEGRLKSADSVATIIGKIFPSPGTIDEAEFNNAVDVSDRSVIYKDVFDSHTTVKPADRAKLKTAFAETIDLVKTVEADTAGLTAVFGTESATAKSNYTKTRAELVATANNMRSRLTTDYNLDDPEVGLGGWADYSAQEMHLLLNVVQVKDEKKTKITLIHEGSHLADNNVDDRGYYASPGFEAMTDAEKVANAAHYEELPRRELGTSLFPGLTFTPGQTASGAAMTREDQVRREASEYLRKAWDAAVDTRTLIRDIRKAYLNGNPGLFTTHRALLLEISKLMDLTIHEQVPDKALVTTLDVTLSESIARAMNQIRARLKTVAFPDPVGKLTDLELRDMMLADAVTAYGALLKDATRDKALMDWMVAHYRTVPSA
jgi:hypothetical protein